MDKLMGARHDPAHKANHGRTQKTGRRGSRRMTMPLGEGKKARGTARTGQAKAKGGVLRVRKGNVQSMVSNMYF